MRFFALVYFYLLNILIKYVYCLYLENYVVMSEISDALISEYNSNPVNFYEMKDFTVSHHE